ncbi:glycosyltransferase family 2 protein [Pedobacter nyackensis]|uniref:glycosyltransferase family 2 protein n=1 Tax=Pedobacter nyackensis TaxID=475255 RepID=UPI00293064C2|nr:glycosyltransferase family 2 protein [Pedobacter nyackensis]
MQKKITVALLISTYNWPEALELTLLSALNQTQMPDEILIADDGSTESTKTIIEKYALLFPIPIRHLWQEDKGFRLAKIRNKAIAKTNSDYIIQIDGDIIMHPYFIQDHIKFAKPNSFVRASRVYINEVVSNQMLEKCQYKISAFSKGISNFFSAVRIPFLWKYFEKNYKMKGEELYEIHGCNMAFWRKDAIKVNGYNESFNGWGPEDKEFITRLLNSGVQKRFIKLGAIAFHIYHKENAKTFLKENTETFKEAILHKKTYNEFGINQYL